MGKRRRKWDEQRYLLDLKSGVSQGTGADYIPGISVHDFPSRGIVARISGRKTGRIHHLLSHWEEYYFYLLDTDPDVLDIQEQFWLRLSETLDIASRFNILHPQQGSFFSPLSTDFLIFRQDGIQARTIKETRELSNPRVLEKFSIECQYWKERGIDWKVVTEKEINLIRSRNLQWLYAPPTAAEAVPDEAFRNEALELLMELLKENQFSFSAIIEIVEDALSLKHGCAISLFKELVLSGRLSMNLDRPLNFMDPLAKEA